MAKSKKGKKQQRMLKAQRHDNKFWAEGGRDTILRRRIPEYTAGLQMGWVEERHILKLIRREYDYHVDWRLRDDEEPPQPFREWTPATEREPLNLTEEEAIEHAAYSDFTTKRIRRWLNYRARKLMKKYSNARSTNLDDPFIILLARLTGVTKPKKARQAYQQWSHVHYEELIKPTVVEEWEAYKEANGVDASKGLNAGFRGKVTHRMFLDLSGAEQVKWAKQAKAFSEAERKEYEIALKRPYATDPASRQRAINDFSKFMTPILEGCAEILGFNVLLMAGGPIPKYGGEIGTVSIPIGKNRDPIPSTFTDYNAGQFTAIKEVYKTFLRSAYSDKDIKAAAMPEGVTASDMTDLLPLEDEIRAIHDSADLSDDSDTDDESDDESDDDSDDEAPAVVGKKRSRAKGGQTEPTKRTKVDGRKETLGRGGRSKGASVKEDGQAAGNAGGAEKIQESVVEEPSSMFPEGSYQPIDLPFDVSDPAILSTASTGFSFSELTAPLGDGVVPNYMDAQAVPDHMNPEFWGMQDWLFDGMGGNSDAMAWIDSSTTTPSTGIGGEAAAATWPAAFIPAVSTSLAASTSPATFPSTFPSPATAPSPATSITAASTTSRSLIVTPSSQSETRPGGDPIVVDTDVSAAPSWFQDLWNYLKSEDLGRQFSWVMTEWYHLEKAYSFANPRVGYGTKGRPEILSSWIKGGRLRVANPSISNLAKFKPLFWGWWKLQQPTGRDVCVQIAPDGGSWESAKFPGVNGMCSFVALLRWWGEAAKGDTQEMIEWKKAVDDVAWVMGMLRSK